MLCSQCALNVPPKAPLGVVLQVCDQKSAYSLIDGCLYLLGKQLASSFLPFPLLSQSCCTTKVGFFFLMLVNQLTASLRPSMPIIPPWYMQLPYSYYIELEGVSCIQFLNYRQSLHEDLLGRHQGFSQNQLVRFLGRFLCVLVWLWQVVLLLLLGVCCSPLASQCSGATF